MYTFVRRENPFRTGFLAMRDRFVNGQHSVGFDFDRAEDWDAGT